MLQLPDSEVAAALVRHARAARRVRLEIDALVGDARLGRRIEATVEARPGVVRVVANPRSGRVLIELAPDAAILAELEELAHRGQPRSRDRLRRRRRIGDEAHVPSAPHATEAAAVVDALRSSEHEGLSTDEARRRLELYGPNVLDGARPPSRLQLAVSQLTNLPTALLLGSAVISILLGDVIDAGAIVTVVGLNAVIGYRMERTSEELLAAWQHAEAGTVEVLRDSRPQTVRSSQLVPGDVLLVRAGNIVPADARILEAHRLSADESALTGESEPAPKHDAPVATNTALADRTSMLYSGTSVATGHGRAIVVACGEATELGAVQRLAAASRGPRARLSARLDALASRLAWSGLVASGISTLASLAWRRRALDVVRDTVALGVAAIPEGLPVTSNAALVRAMSRMRERGIIVRRLGTAEALGGVTVACADKTGTLTENRMRLEVMWIDGHRIAASDIARSTTCSPDGPIGALLAAAVLNSDLDYHQDNGGALHLAGSATERALARAAEVAGFDLGALRARFGRLRLIERSEGTHYVISEHRAADGSPLAFAKGAPEQIVELCALGPDAAPVLAANEQLGAEGLRVLAVASRDGTDTPWRLLGLVGLRDPLRAGSADAVRAAARAGIRTVMLTGDQRATAEAIAREVGLDGEVIEGAELPALLADPCAAERLRRLAVVARVSPAEKVAVVEALRGAGELVAMAGDGINDAPALKAADIGIAVGVRATDLARQTADIVLEHEDLRSILTAIAEGRIVQDNLRRSVRFQVAGNLGEVLLITGAALVGRPVISPLGLLWINLLTDTLPGLALALEPGDPDVLDRPPAPPSAPILDRADWRTITRDGSAIAAASGIAALLGGPLAAFATIGSVQFGYASTCRTPNRVDSGRRFVAMIGGSAALHLAAVAVAPVRSLLRLSGSVPLALASFGLSFGAPLVVAARRQWRYEVTRQGTASGKDHER